MATFRELYDSLDGDPNVKGRQWERLCAWYLENAPDYRRRLEKVWLWDEWPGRWGADAGIDLVARTPEGELWAIQAKATGPAKSLKKREMDSFLAESARPEFVFRLLIATTNRLSQQSERAMDGQSIPVGRVLLADLEAAAVDWPSNPTDLRPRPQEPYQPFDYQSDAVADVVAGFDEVDRGQLIMACGTGKTYVGLWVAERLDSKRTLVLVPSLSLLSQTMKDWMRNARVELAAPLPVCSDDTVRDEEDQIVARSGELGVPVTTDPSAIAAYLRRRGRRVVFCTYQSSHRVAEAFELGRVPGFDLVVADEAHRTAGAVQSDFAIVLGSGIRAKRRLFMTATPKFFTGRVIKAAEETDYEVASMDDRAVYGPVFHRLTFGEAIERELLSDYRVVVVGVDDPTIEAQIRRRSLVASEAGQLWDARALSTHIALAKAMKRFDLRRIIAFHNRIRGARLFARAFPSVVSWMPAGDAPDGDVRADYVAGTMSAGQRAVKLDQLRSTGPNQRSVLSNARCLAEGVSVPRIDGLTFVDPRRSQIDVVQAVGRAIRKAPDKTHGTIVLPVFLEPGSDPEQAVNRSAFKNVWQVINALRDHDADLAEKLDALRRQLGRGTTAGWELPDQIELDLPVEVSESFSNALRTLLVETTTASWHYWYGLLLSYVEQHGHSALSSKEVFEGHNLGSWVAAQRGQRKRLSSERRGMLEVLPGWSWSLSDTRFERSLAALWEFFHEHGHTRVPVGHYQGDVSLRTWVVTVRLANRRGSLDPEKLSAVEEIPGWQWAPLEEAWEEGLEILKAFVHREGHAAPKRPVVVDGFPIGEWTKYQRRARKMGRLSNEQIQRLESLPGWDWAVRAKTSILEVERISHSGSCARQGCERNPVLTRWCRAHRHQRRKGKATSQAGLAIDSVLASNRSMVRELDSALLATGQLRRRPTRKRGVSYVTHDGIPVATVVFSNAPLKAYVVVPGSVQIRGATTRDATLVGHDGYGDLEIQVTSASDVPHVVNAAKMSVRMLLDET